MFRTRELAGETGECGGTWPGEVECFGRGNLRGKLESLGELGRGKLKGLMEIHGRIVRGTRTGFEGSVGEFSHVGDILTCFNSVRRVKVIHCVLIH